MMIIFTPSCREGLSKITLIQTPVRSESAVKVACPYHLSGSLGFLGSYLNNLGHGEENSWQAVNVPNARNKRIFFSIMPNIA